MINAPGPPGHPTKASAGGIRQFHWSTGSITRMMKKFEIGLFAVLILILFLLILNRIHYGVDLTDEAYNLAIPYRLSLGDLPFIDEIDPHQTSSLMLVPIIKLYTLLFGTEFLVLSMRYVYILFTLGIAYLIHKSVRDTLGWKLSLLVSLFLVACAPTGAIFFNYNRLAYLMFSAGCFLGILPRGRLFWSGILHGLAIIAYPFFVIPCAVFFSIQLLSKRRSKMADYVYGAVIPLFVFLVIAWRIGFDRVLEMAWSLRSGIHGGGFEKFGNVFVEIWNQIHYKGLILIYCVVVFVLFRRQKQFVLALLVIPLFPFLALGIRDPFAPSWYVIFYGLFAPYLMLFARKDDNFLPSIFLGIWIPAFAAGLTTAVVSANGTINFAIGLIPGALVTSIQLVSLISENSSGPRRHFSALVPISLLIVFLGFQYSFIYSEGRFSGLSARIESGPYGGLYTTPAKRQYLESIMSDFEKFRLDQGRVLFFDFFPAGYLFSTMRPAANSVWLLPPGLFNTSRELNLRYYTDNSRLPDVSIRLNLVYTYTGSILNLKYSEDDPLIALVRRVSDETYKGENCSIYYRK
jgi:hypothetical protein